MLFSSNESSTTLKTLEALLVIFQILHEPGLREAETEHEEKCLHSNVTEICSAAMYSIL